MPRLVQRLVTQFDGPGAAADQQRLLGILGDAEFDRLAAELAAYGIDRERD